MRKALLGLCIAALCFASACSQAPAAGPNGEPPICEGKCDDNAPRYRIDFDKLNRQFPGETEVTETEDAFRVRVHVGDQVITADTHLFGEAVNIIPYHNDDTVRDAAGSRVARGDGVIAHYYPPGQIGFAIKHHRPEFRDLVLGEGGGDDAEMKEHFKLQDTHIELVVGVANRDGSPGVITLNNPQDYEGGRFGEADYPMIFTHPQYPEYLSEAQKRAFNDNIRTMMLGFNAVSEFPGDYNGGDPLAARTPAEVLRHATMMVKAIAGDRQARQFFQDPANNIYCAELAHVASSAGLVAPLSAAFFVPLVGQDVWDAFVAETERHNRGEESAFTTLNANPYAALVEVTLADDELQPAAEYAPAAEIETARAQLAFQPMTMADIIANFLRTHLPREVLGEQLAPVQGAVLEQMRPGLLEQMGMDRLPESDPRRQAVEGLYTQLVGVVSTPFSDYEEFRTNLEPLLAQARAVTGPRDGGGEGLFVPPSALHLVLQGKLPGGMLGLAYVGHGLHYSQVRRQH